VLGEVLIGTEGGVSGGSRLHEIKAERKRAAPNFLFLNLGAEKTVFLIVIRHFFADFTEALAGF
jgi:hypothetical protein